ncbi:unnamed protein product [Paramecium sonneborni]|uniref:NACHT domain-containing protein n=1 Tax=Paramecium sonneborni TaxID=65129 RepID=A0A8S1QAK9_9CILI|nr:unnamed protein product [Paramecium sonneborni]
MNIFQEYLDDTSLIQSSNKYIDIEKINLIQRLKSIDKSNGNCYLYTILDTSGTLRGGGGCCVQKYQQNIQQIVKSVQIPINFAINLTRYTNIIEEKSNLFCDKIYQDEILIAFQWFYNQKECFQILCNDDSQNSINYELIEKNVEKLMKQLPVYIKISGYLFHSLLQICNDLFRIIFSYQLKNEERYIQEDFQQKLLDNIFEIEEQIKVESSKIWITGVEFELQLIKICITHLRTNSKKGEQLLISFLCQVATSVSQLQPTSELIDTIIEGGKFLLMNFYEKQIQHPLEKYEIYYFFENLKWSIVNQLKQGFSTKTTINHLQNGYSKYIQQSKDWMIHFCWINLLSDIMAYRPIISKKQVMQIQNNHQAAQKLITLESLFTQLAYDKSFLKFKLFPDDKKIFQNMFQELRLFEEYLLEEQDKIQLLPNYLNFKFDYQYNGQINNLDLNIQIFTKQSNLQILNTLNDLFLQSQCGLIQNIQLFDKLFKNLKTNHKTQSNEILEIKQNISEIFKQIKQQMFLCLLILYQIQLSVIREIEINKVFKQILEKEETNLSQNNKILKQQLLKIIKDLESNYESQFQINIKKIIKFWIKICQIISIYKSEYIFEENDLVYSQVQKDGYQISNEFEQTFLIIHKFIQQFVFQINQSKKIFQKIYESKEIESIFQETLTQRKISDIAIQLYNPELILELNQQFQESFSTLLQFRWKLQIIQDLKDSFIGCSFLRFILKTLRRLIQIHKLNLNHLISQKNSLRNNTVKQSDDQDFNSYKSQIIETLIKEKRQLIQNHFDKYNDRELSDQEVNDLSELQKSVNLWITKIQFQNWPSEIQTSLTILFQEIQTKLKILELNYKYKNSINEEILQLTDNFLQTNFKNISLQQINIIDQEEQNNQIIPGKDKLFNCELLIQKINILTGKSQKVKKIIQQKYMNINFSQSIPKNSIIVATSWENFIEKLNEILKEIQQLNYDCVKSISDQEQIVFVKSINQQLSTTQSFNQINANIILYNTPTLLDDITFRDELNDTTFSFYLSELRKDLISKQGREIVDMFGDSSYKVRESLVFNLIKIQSIVLESPIKEFCSQLLKNLWIIEKHDSVRKILKNQEMIEMQKRLFSQDLINFSNSLKLEMQAKLKSIEQLETLVLIGDNQTEMKKKLEQAYDDFEIYLDNITDMSNRLDISLVFLKEITKDLKKIKNSIDQILQSVQGLEADIRKLRGKDFMELLQIRKQKVLKQMLENELDQIHVQISTQEYDPVSGIKKKTIKRETQISYLLKQQYNDFDGEINEFLWSENDRQKDVMLLRGKAGSGKSRASSNIEELLWICDQQQPFWIPIFVSLPSLIDPRHNLINQALESENYNFDKTQIRDFKEAICNGKLKVLFILESYDEIKTDFISSNFYQTNRFAKDLNLQIPGLNVKIIITTREEILTSIGYQIWFYGSSIKTLKEVELLPFNNQQSQEYIKKYIQISIKRTIKRFYEFLKQLKGLAFEIHEFKQIWSNLESFIDSIINQKQIDDGLFSSIDTERLLKKLQQIQFFNFINTDQMIWLKKDLLQLWSEQKFLQVIKNVNIDHLLCTPFMMEIIVYVLPKMSQQFSQASYIRNIVTQNYLILKRQSYQSQQLIHQFQANQVNENQQFNDDKLTSLKLNQNQIKADKAILEQFNFIMEELDNQDFFESYSITNQLEYISNTCIGASRDFHVKFDANFIVAALKFNQLTAFDFYETFVNYYTNQQIEKYKDLGKIINHESFYIDLQDFSLSLAIDMSMRQITQVNYKQKGKLQIQNLHEDRNDQITWDDLYFDEISDNQEYKSLLKKCMLINSKGNLYAFNHKSIQDFFVAKYILKLYQTIFNQNQDINIQSLEKSVYNNILFNLSQEHYFGSLELLKPKLISLENIKSKLIQMTKLSKTDLQHKVIRSASNSIYLLSYLGEYFQEIDFSNISISNTKLNKLTFFQCNLNFSKFDNVCIDSCNFNCASIKNGEWKNLICTEKRFLDGHILNIISIDFTDDGKSLISVEKTGVIMKWLIYNDEHPKSLNLQTDVFQTSYSKTLNVLICQTKKYIYFINCQELQMDEIYSLPNCNCSKICLQPEMQYLAADIVMHNKVYLWQIKDLQSSNQIQPIISQSINKSSITCLAITKDFKLIATGHYQIKIWLSENCKEYQEITQLYEDLKQKTQSIIFSQNEEILITGGEDQRISFWNIKNHDNIQLQLRLDTFSKVNSLSYQIEAKFIAVRTDYYIKLYDAENPILSQHFFRQEIDFQYNIFQISPNSKTLAILKKKNDEESTIMIWNIQDYTQMNLIKSFASKKNKKDQIKQLQFSPDGQVLVEVTNNSIYLWDLKDYELISKLENQFNNIQNLSFSTDQIQFAICCANKQLTLWNIQKLNSPQNIATLNLQHECCQAHFCPNEQIIITYSNSSQPTGITFWDAIQYKQITTVINDEVIRNVCFNQDGNIMISFSNSLRVWKKNQQQFEIQEEYRYNCKQISQSFMINQQRIIALKNKCLYEIILSDNKQINDENFGYNNEVKNFDLASNRQFLIINGNDKKRIILFMTDQQQQTMLYQNEYTIFNDFSISQDHKIIAIASQEGITIKDMETKRIITSIQEIKKCSCVIFYQQQGNNFMIIGSQVNEGQLALYDINNLSQIIKIKLITLLSRPLNMYLLQESQQLIIVYKHFLTINKIDNLEQSKMIPIRGAQSFSNNLIINQDQSAIILGVEDEICIYSLQNQIETVGFSTIDDKKILHMSFSKYNQTLIIIKENSIYIEWDLNLRKIIKQANFNNSSQFYLTINERETQLISVKSENSKQYLKIIDLISMNVINSFEELNKEKVAFISAAYTQDGTSFITGYTNRTFKFWDSKSCKLLQMFNSYTSTIDLIQISNLGIMAQVNQNQIKLWNLIALKQQQSNQEGHSDQINRLIVSPDGLSLVSGSESQIIRWDLKENKKIDVLLKGQKLPSYFFFSCDGQYFAALEEQNWIKIWKITSLYIIEHCFQLSFSNDTLNFQFNIKDYQLVSKNKEQQIMIWDLKKAYLCEKLPKSIQNSQKSITIFSSDAQLILASNPLKILYPEQYFQFDIDQTTNIGFIAISHNSKLLAIENINKSIIIWSVSEKKLLHTFNFANKKDLPILTIVFSGNNKTLLSTHQDIIARLWNVEDGQYQLLQEVEIEFFQYKQFGSIQTFPVNDDNFITIWSEFQGYDCILQSYLNYYYFQGLQQKNISNSQDYELKNFSVGYNNQKQIFAIQFFQQLHLYDINSDKIVAKLEGNQQSNQILSTIISFSPDGSKLITWGANHIIRLWDLSDINDIKYKINFKSLIEAKAAQFLMDGENIRIISKDNKIYNHNIQEFTQFCRIPKSKQFEFQGEQNFKCQKYQVNFNDLELNIKDVATNQIKCTFNQFSSKVTTFAFTPSYQQFILGMKDGSIFLYLIEQKILDLHKKPVCYKIFAKSTQLQVNFCQIGESIFETQEKENLRKLLFDKGAIE